MTNTARPLAPTKSYPVHYKTVAIDEQEVFYHEAGPTDAPAMLLLHGFPTSSNMFRNLITRLAPTFHVIAPDYIGYGLSSMPDRKTWTQFAHDVTFKKPDSETDQKGRSSFR